MSFTMSKLTCFNVHLPLPPSLHEKKQKEARKDVRLAVEASLAGVRLDKTRLYRLELTFFGRWLNGIGMPDPHMPDTLNMAKVIEDEVFRAIGVNDRHNFEYEIKKRPGEFGCSVFIVALTERAFSGS